MNPITRELGCQVCLSFSLFCTAYPTPAAPLSHLQRYIRTPPLTQHFLHTIFPNSRPLGQALRSGSPSSARKLLHQAAHPLLRSYAWAFPFPSPVPFSHTPFSCLLGVGLCSTFPGRATTTHTTPTAHVYAYARRMCLGYPHLLPSRQSLYCSLEIHERRMVLLVLSTLRG